ncbi:RHS repeat-associated core domain-containing protein [Pseudomonas capeferrum]|uniref:RHS repeat-associated core domain-containing protein n=1 Tax=Pseudomonas capeferrum TaxID=1495066 RepID=UPI0030D7AC5B
MTNANNAVTIAKDVEGLYCNFQKIDCIKVNPMTGKGGLKLPLAMLGSEEGGALFELAISSPIDSPDVSLLPVGSWTQELKLVTWDEECRSGEYEYTLEFEGLLHPDGRRVNTSLNNHGRQEGAGFLLDASVFAQKRVEYANSQERRERLVGEAQLDSMSEHELAEHQQEYSYYHELDECQVALISKNGAIYIFDCCGEGHPSEVSNVLLTRFVPAVGRSLTFTWGERNSRKPRLLSIADDLEGLVQLKWKSDTQFSVDVYPTAQHTITYDIKVEENTWVVKVLGGDALAEEQTYRIDTSSGRINGVSLETQYGTVHKKAMKRIDAETLKYKGKKVQCHTVSLADGLDVLSREYTYEVDKTTIAFKRSDTKVTTQVLEYKDGVQTSETLTSASGATTSRRHEVELDEASGTATLTTTCKTGEHAEQKSVMKIDALGNLVRLEEGGQITEWTYYKNYKHYEVEEWRAVHAEAGFGAWMYRALFGMQYTDLLPLELGGDRGLTSSVWTLSSVRASLAHSDYGKATFNLPIKIEYPGDGNGLVAHVESQKVSHVVDGKPQVQHVTYYGYETLTRASIDGIATTTLVVPTHRLMVLGPNLESVDLSTRHFELAASAAGDWLTTLDKQIKKASSDDEKSEYSAQKKNLEASLRAQSVLNANGFKLKNWNATRIQVERLEYSTDASKPDFGQVTSQTVYLLDKTGKEIAGSRKKTSIVRAVDAQNKRQRTLSTTLEVGGTQYASSQTITGYNDQVVQTKDSNALQTDWSFTDGGLLKGEQYSQGDEASSKMKYSTALLSNGHIRYQTIDSETNAGQRVTVDALGREQEVRRCVDGTNWLLWASITRDDKGRVSSLVEYDYDGAGTRLSSQATQWAADKDKKRCTVTHILRDAENKEVNRKSKVVAATNEGTRVTHGSFEYSSQYDAATQSLTFTQASSSDKTRQLKRTLAFTSDGALQSFTSRSCSGNKETIINQVAYGYNSAGLLNSKTSNSQPSSTYEYDAFGRVTKQVSNGIELRSEYSQTHLSPDATLTTVHGSDAAAITLGSQTLDSLGRVSTRTVNGVSQEFSYPGSSRSNNAPALTGPAAMAGYVSRWNMDTITYTETCPVHDSSSGAKAATLSTSSRYSLRGRLLDVTDIGGTVTHYAYDAYGRLSGLSSEACKTSFTYADNGHLKEETVKDEAGGRTVTVAYAYDEMGNETSRTFSSEGMPTHVMERKLTSAGKLKENTLKVASKEHFKETFGYDVQGRLITWSTTGQGYVHNTNTVHEQAFSYDVLSNVISSNLQARPASPGSASWRAHIDREFTEKKPGLLSKHGSTVIKSDDKGRWNGFGTSYYENGQVKTSEWRGNVYAPGKVSVTFGYDDLGRVRGLYTAGNNDSTRGFQLHYRGGKVYARSQVTSNTTMWRGVTQRQLILLNESPGCYLQQRRDKKGGSQPSVSCTFELRDAAGTVFATVDQKGAVSYHTYSPYGYADAGDEWENWLGFKGEVLLPDDTYYLGNYRVYDPKLMSFRTPDSWSPFGAGGPAAYAYCAGDPVNYHDPSGHQVVAQYSRQEAIPAMYTKEFRIAMSVLNVVVAPFTGGASLAVAAATTGLALVAASFEIASVMLEDSDKDLSAGLAVVGFGFGLASMAAGMSGGAAAAASRSSSTKFVLNRTMGGGSNFRNLSRDIRLFEDVHKGRPRLVIEGHGGPGYIDVNGSSMNAYDFLDYMDHHNVNYHGYELKLHVCDSATISKYSGSSFARDLAMKLGVEVKGYRGPMEVAGLVGEARASGEALTKFDVVHTYQEIVDIVGVDIARANLQPRKVEWVYRDHAYVLGADGKPMLERHENFKPVTYHVNPRNRWMPVERIHTFTSEQLMKRYLKNPTIYEDPLGRSSPVRIDDYDLT